MNSNQPHEPPPAGGFGAGPQGAPFGPTGYGQNHFGFTGLQPAPSKSLAVGALVAGIVSILGVLLCGGFGLPIGIGAIIMGAMARRRVTRMPAQYTGHGLAIAGLWCGIAGTTLNLCYFGFIAWMILGIGR